MRRALVLHLTLGASCGYDVEILNEKVKAPPLRRHQGLCSYVALVYRSFTATETSCAMHGRAGKQE